jgi:hypothetical protein
MAILDLSLLVWTTHVLEIFHILQLLIIIISTGMVFDFLIS